MNKKVKKKTCIWRYDTERDDFVTGCHKRLPIPTILTKTFKMNYCPFCGNKRLRVFL